MKLLLAPSMNCRITCVHLLEIVFRSVLLSKRLDYLEIALGTQTRDSFAIQLNGPPSGSFRRVLFRGPPLGESAFVH